MMIESIEIEMDITAAEEDLAQSIEANLQKWGEPLRWAITTVDPNTNIAQIEVIIIKD
jgi:hypothetical protein